MAQTLIRKFIIEGLHYYQDLEINFDEPVHVIVGENGLGKTTMLKALYFLLGRRWYFLSNIGFDFIELNIDGVSIAFSQSELQAYLISKNKLLDVNVTQELINKFKKIEEQLERYRNRIIFFPSYRNILADTLNLGFPFSFNDREDVTYEEHVEATEIIDETLFTPTLDNVFNSVADADDNNVRSKFQQICNSYLESTEINYTKDNKLRIINRKSKDVVKPFQLSTGEKQILFIFSKILFNKSSDLIVLFDEPELSLSIKWQRKILVDIVDSNKCKFLLAMTHSPFIFKNKLEKYAIGMNPFIE